MNGREGVKKRLLSKKMPKNKENEGRSSGGKKKKDNLKI
jgi:hypothetical protein